MRFFMLSIICVSPSCLQYFFQSYHKSIRGKRIYLFEIFISMVQHFQEYSMCPGTRPGVLAVLFSKPSVYQYWWKHLHCCVFCSLMKMSNHIIYLLNKLYNYRVHNCTKDNHVSRVFYFRKNHVIAVVHCFVLYSLYRIFGYH